MNRLIKWIIGLLIIVGGGYLILVALTGSKVREITEEQLESYAAQNTNVSAEVIWHETGFWRSEGEVRMTITLEPGVSGEVHHTLNLRHGALRARMSGELSARFGDFDMAEYLFDGEPVVLDGRVSMAGVRATYHVPPLELTADTSEMVFLSSPFDIEVVLTEREQHVHIDVDWLRLLPQHQEQSTDGLYIENVEIITQVRLDSEDGLGKLGSSKSTVERMTVGVGPGEPMVAEDYFMEISFEREANNLDMQIDLGLEKLSVQGINGDGKISVRLTDLPFEAWRSFESESTEVEDNREALRAVLIETRDNGARIHVDSVDLGAEGFGRLVANGEFILRDELPSIDEGSGAADFLNGYLTIEDLPMPLTMILAGMVSGELPWRFELQDGSLLINGESLDSLVQ